MNNYPNSSHSTYQTIPPTTVMMAGNNMKEDSPMTLDENVGDLNTENGFDSEPRLKRHPDNSNESGTIFQHNDELQASVASSNVGNGDAIAFRLGQNPQVEKKPGSNVIVDESPLQLQMEKNKECKFNIWYLNRIFYTITTLLYLGYHFIRNMC